MCCTTTQRRGYSVGSIARREHNNCKYIFSSTYGRILYVQVFCAFFENAMPSGRYHTVSFFRGMGCPVISLGTVGLFGPAPFLNAKEGEPVIRHTHAALPGFAALCDTVKGLAQKEKSAEKDTHAHTYRGRERERDLKLSSAVHLISSANIFTTYCGVRADSSTATKAQQ